MEPPTLMSQLISRQPLVISIKWGGGENISSFEYHMKYCGWPFSQLNCSCVTRGYYCRLKKCAKTVAPSLQPRPQFTYLSVIIFAQFNSTTRDSKMLAFGTFLTFLLALSRLVAGDGHNSILNFPTASTANYISFDPEFPAFAGLTVCGWQKKAYTDWSRYWFSYAVPGTDNEIIMGDREAGFVFYLGGSWYGADLTIPENQWVHFCATWDSESGVSTVSVNGELLKTQENFKKGWKTRAGGNLVIGQEQDSVGGRFETSQAYVGRLSNINVWDYPLNSSEITYLYEAGFCGYSTTAVDPIISYDDILSQELHGDAAVVQDGSCMDLEDPSDGKILRFPPVSEVSTGNFLQFSPDFGSDEFTQFSICTWFFKTYADTSHVTSSATLGREWTTQSSWERDLL